jgi:hypothetical protein
MAFELSANLSKQYTTLNQIKQTFEILKFSRYQVNQKFAKLLTLLYVILVTKFINHILRKSSEYVLLLIIKHVLLFSEKTCTNHSQ